MNATISSDTVIELYKNNNSIRKIAKILNISTPTIVKILKINNMEIKNPGIDKFKTKLTEQQELELCNDYKNLISREKLMKKYNIGWRKLNRIFTKYNVETNKTTSYPNPMSGTHFYKKWVEKYGEKIANKKMKKVKKRFSELSKGKNNHMYGKPSPKGSGQGWKGHYKDFYFRSLRELTYVLTLDKNNIPWESAERECFSIKYKNYDGSDRTYRPDFLIDNNTLVEIKPKRLQKSPLIKLKAQAALDFCKKSGLKFQILDIEINQELIIKALDSGYIKFSRDYEQKFREYCNVNQKLSS